MATRLLRINSTLLKYSNKNGSIKVSKHWRSTAASTAPSLQSILVNQPPTRTTTLQNGMTVASEDNGASTATVALWVDAGSRCESEDHNGVAHLFEHMAFRGTAKRSEADLVSEIENMGAQLNACTTREHTVFYANCLKQDVPKIVDILGDMIQNSTLDESAIVKERGVILKEMQETETDLKTVVYDHLHSVAYQGTPLGRTILGPSENLKCNTKKDIQDYVRNNYGPPRFVLAGAGGVEHNQLVKLAEEHFGKMTGPLYDAIPDLDQSCRYTGSEIRVRDDALPLAHIAIAVEGPGWKSPDHLPLVLMDTMMGIWNRSQGGGLNNATPLARIGASGELCHSYENFNISYKGTGLWGIYFVCEPMQCDDMIWNIQQEWMKLCLNATEKDVARAKNALKTRMLLQLNDNTGISEDIGKQVLCHGRRLPLHELESQIESITAKTVQETGMKYIYDRCPVIAAVGPCENLTDYNVIRSAMWWARF